MLTMQTGFKKLQTIMQEMLGFAGLGFVEDEGRGAHWSLMALKDLFLGHIISYMLVGSSWSTVIELCGVLGVWLHVVCVRLL